MTVKCIEQQITVLTAYTACVNHGALQSRNISNHPKQINLLDKDLRSLCLFSCWAGHLPLRFHFIFCQYDSIPLM